MICDLRLVMGESGLGPIIEAQHANQGEGGSTSIGEIHHHPVTKPNKNGSSPGYLKVNIQLIVRLQYDILESQIDQRTHQIHSLSRINFGVSQCK